MKIAFWKDSVIGAVYKAKTHSVAYGNPDKDGIYKIWLADKNGGK